MKVVRITIDLKFLSNVKKKENSILNLCYHIYLEFTCKRSKLYTDTTHWD